MENTESYLNFRPTHVDYYMKNNYIDGNKITTDELYLRIMQDIELALRALKIQTSRIGYAYWKDAILYCILTDKDRLSVCYEVYPMVAKKHGCTTISVERVMRLCFENTLYYVKNDTNYITSFMKHYLVTPHNGQLLSKFVELIISSEFRRFKNAIQIEVL